MNEKKEPPMAGNIEGKMLKGGNALSGKDNQKTTINQKFKKSGEIPVIPETIPLFKVQTANQFITQAATRPAAARLFGDFFREGELCILFADTNTGKSLLAVQIGESLARGGVIAPFQNEAEKHKVLYFDFELSDKQFQARYTDATTGELYSFSENFLRAEINPDSITDITEITETYLYQQFEQSIINSGAKIVIVDNLTYLKHETEKSRNALPLMKMLKLLKIKHNITILTVAHTPKRDATKPITRNDLGGSKMLINFADSAFCVGESSKDTAIRYLKQIKARDSEIVYHSDNVGTFQIQKPDRFLHFDFMGFSTEAEHLKIVSDPDKQELKDRARELYEGGMSYRKIAVELLISHSYVGKLLKNQL